MPLAAEGEQQARLLGERLRAEPIAAAYASDLQRAYRTAEIAVTGRGFPLAPQPTWRERAWGIWEGLNRDQVRERYPDEHIGSETDPVRFTPTNGESAADCYARAIASIKDLHERHPSETVLVVTHGGVLLMVSAWAYGLPLDSRQKRPVSNCGLCAVHWEGGAPEVEFWNDVAHLGDVEAATQSNDYRATGYRTL